MPVTVIYLKSKYWIFFIQVNNVKHNPKTIQKVPNPTTIYRNVLLLFSHSSCTAHFMAVVNDTKLTCSIPWFNTGCQAIERTANGNARPQRNFNGTWTEQVSYIFAGCSCKVLWANTGQSLHWVPFSRSWNTGIISALMLHAWGIEHYLINGRHVQYSLFLPCI